MTRQWHGDLDPALSEDLYRSKEHLWGTGTVLVCAGVAGQWPVPAGQTLTY